MARLAVDFGTSNTAAATANGILALEPGQTTLPTAVFYDMHDKSAIWGSDAVAALIDGREGRFLRALKSVLGQPLLRESRMLGGVRTTLLEVIARFLTEIKMRAEAETGKVFGTVLSGRPVRFHSKNADYNDQAEVDLRKAYALAGFTDIQFMPEPEAAALASGGVADGYGLVVDIGGGTSDYSVFTGQGENIQVIGNYGIRLGGTDFDRLLNIDLVMPELGLGSVLKNEMGPGRNDAPKALFHDLATWEKIPFQYTPQTVRDVKHMGRLAIEPKPWQRLSTVLEMELAHEIAHAVEQGKIAANSAKPTGVNLGFVEKGLSIGLSEQDLTRVLATQAAEIGAAALMAPQVAGVEANQVTRVVMVGGSSLMGVIEAAIRAVLPNAQIDRSDAFTAIVEGLAIGAARLD